MRDIFIVAKYTFSEMIKRKSFIISTLIILLFVVVGFNVPNIIKKFSTSSESTIAIIDEYNIFGSTLNDIDTLKLPYKFEVNLNDYEDKISNNEIDAAIVITKDESDNISLSYVVLDSLYVYSIPDDILSSLEILYRRNSLNDINLTPEQINKLFPNFNIEVKQLSEESPSGNIAAMMVLSVLLFYAVYFCAFQVSSSITTEKTSKIIETLATSTSPTNIVIGKTFGIGVAGLLQILSVIIVALCSAKICLEPELINSIIDPSSITFGLFLIMIGYFILGYLLFAFMYALTGSTVSKPEEVQSANGPVAFIAVIGFYLSYFTMVNPTNDLNMLASMLPISSPFCMPLRYMMGLSSIGEVIGSMAILIATIILVAYVTIRIYKNAILNYGAKLNMKEIIKLFKQK